MEMKIKIDKRVDSEEFFKVIGFISEDIIDYDINDGVLHVKLKSGTDIEGIKKRILSHEKAYIRRLKAETLYSQNILQDYYDDKVLSRNFVDFGEGNVALKEKALLLYRFFDSNIKKIAYKFGAKEKIYPALLSMETYNKTSYLKSSPQYAIYCSKPIEDISILSKTTEKYERDDLKAILHNPTYALSPSACFHVYQEYGGYSIDREEIITFNQNVFRNEGRFNFSKFGRLQGYHVREIVFLGNHQKVLELRHEIMENIWEFIKSIKMNAQIVSANDSFIVPEMQKMKKIQLVEKSKYELKANYSKEDALAIGSFNLHGRAFSIPFNITMPNSEFAESGCIGIGIERLVMVFLKQYGDRINNWPEILKKNI